MVATKDMVKYYPADEKPCENFESLVAACYDDFAKGEGNFDIPYIDCNGHLTVSKGIVLCYEHLKIAKVGQESRFETYGYTDEQQECLIKATKLIKPSEFMSMKGGDTKVFTKKDGKDTYEIELEKVSKAGAAKVISVTKNGKKVEIPKISEEKAKEAFKKIYRPYYLGVANNVEDLHSLPLSVQCLLMHRAWGGNCSGTGNTLEGAVGACSEWITNTKQIGKSHPLYQQMLEVQKLCTRIEGNKNVKCEITDNENKYNVPIDNIIEHYTDIWKDMDVNVKNYMKERPDEFNQYIANFMAEDNLVDDLRYALYVDDGGNLAHIPCINIGNYNDSDAYINEGDEFKKNASRPVGSIEERNAILAYWKYMELEDKDVDILKFYEFEKMYSELVGTNENKQQLSGEIPSNCVKAYDYVLNNHERDRRFDYVYINPNMPPLQVQKLANIPVPEVSAHFDYSNIGDVMKNQSTIYKMTEDSKIAEYGGNYSGNPRMDELLPDKEKNKTRISANSVIIPYAKDKEK